MDQLCHTHQGIIQHTVIGELTQTQKKQAQLSQELRLLLHHYYSQCFFFQLDQQRPQLKLLHKYDETLQYLSRMLMEGVLTRTDVILNPSLFLPEGGVVLVLELVAICMEKASGGLFRYNSTLDYLEGLFYKIYPEWHDLSITSLVTQQLENCIPLDKPHYVVLTQKAALHLFFLGKQSAALEPLKWNTQSWATCYPTTTTNVLTVRSIKPHDKVPMTSLGEKLSSQDWYYWGHSFAFASLSDFLRQLKPDWAGSCQKPLEPFWKNSTVEFTPWERNWAQRSGIKITCIQKIKQKALNPQHAQRIFENRQRHERQRSISLCQ